jgi:hypothetical protein
VAAIDRGPRDFRGFGAYCEHGDSCSHRRRCSHDRGGDLAHKPLAGRAHAGKSCRIAAQPMDGPDRGVHVRPEYPHSGRA